MSSPPAAYADVTVFDPETVADRATFEAPTTPAAGIEHVFVNGRPVWTDGKPTGECPGRALRRQQMRAEAPLISCRLASKPLSALQGGEGGAREAGG